MGCGLYKKKLFILDLSKFYLDVSTSAHVLRGARSVPSTANVLLHHVVSARGAQFGHASLSGAPPRYLRVVLHRCRELVWIRARHLAQRLAALAEDKCRHHADQPSNSAQPTRC